MSAPVTPTDLLCWRRYVEAAQAAVAARRDVFAQRGTLVELVRRGLDQPGERATALDVAAELRGDELQLLFPDLLSLASFGHGLTERCRQILLRLPAPWLRTHVEVAATPLLAAGGAEEYQALLPLCERIDPALARSLAGRAAASADPEIQEVGEDYLRRARRNDPGTDGSADRSAGNGSGWREP
jgi:hypothetical protein